MYNKLCQAARRYAPWFFSYTQKKKTREGGNIYPLNGPKVKYHFICYDLWWPQYWADPKKFLQKL